MSSSATSFSPPSTLNITHYVPIKLHKDNYIVWKTLFDPVLKTFGLSGYVDGSIVCPEQFVRDTPRSGPIVNPQYLEWMKNDQLIMIWINGTVSEDLLPYVVGFSSSYALWTNLAKRFATISHSHVIQLKTQLQQIKKGSLTISEYLQSFKTISDKLAAAGSQISDTDLLVHILNGLPHEYDAFVTSIRVRYPPVTTEELHSLLLTEEMFVQARHATLLSTPTSTETTFFTNKGGRGSNKGYF